MCKFDKNFLLCTCSDDLEESDIDWKLNRPYNINSINVAEWRLNNKKKFHNIIGSIHVPTEFKNKTPEEVEEYQENLSKLNELLKLREEFRDKKKDEYKNITLNIQLHLNNKDCFDKKIDFKNKDILSIRIDKDLDVWVNYTYVNSFWEISKLSVEEESYYCVSDGEVDFKNE